MTGKRATFVVCFRDGKGNLSRNSDTVSASCRERDSLLGDIKEVTGVHNDNLLFVYDTKGVKINDMNILNEGQGGWLEGFIFVARTK